MLERKNLIWHFIQTKFLELLIIGSRKEYLFVRIPFEQIEHFFSHYKDLEKGKWVKVGEWGDADEARRLILEGIDRAKNSAHI